MNQVIATSATIKPMHTIMMLLLCCEFLNKQFRDSHRHKHTHSCVPWLCDNDHHTSEDLDIWHMKLRGQIGAKSGR
jgi:hypothetical protein